MDWLDQIIKYKINKLEYSICVYVISRTIHILIYISPFSQLNQICLLKVTARQ